MLKFDSPANRRESQQMEFTTHVKNPSSMQGFNDRKTPEKTQENDVEIKEEEIKEDNKNKNDYDYNKV